MKLIYTASQVREAEKPYIEAADYDGYLMQRAADAVAAEAQELLHGTENAKILLLIGPGNNGADTIYAGARLSAKGHRVDAVIFRPQRKEPRTHSPAKVAKAPAYSTPNTPSNTLPATT